MVMQIGQTGLNVQLTMGKTTQQLVLNENAHLLQTSSSELPSTLHDQMLQQLPQIATPDWPSFVFLLPGALAVLNLSPLYYV